MKISNSFFVILMIFQKLAWSDVPILRSLVDNPDSVFKEGEPWSPTDFKLQVGALGLEKDTFETPKQLEAAVGFWKNIYTQIQSDQGVLHDVENLGVVYEKLDFESINTDASLTERERAKAKEVFVEERKNEILKSLQKLATHPADDELSELDKRVRSLWETAGGLEEIRDVASLERIRLQIGQSDRMKEAIHLSGRYLSMMEKIFREEGLPLQLTRLVFVESSFNIWARSKVGASGLWQIMPSAARGRLRMDGAVDLRNHPREATKLAVKILKFNFQLLGSWPMAVTGYNHGPYGIKRLIEKTKTMELGELIKSGESRRFGFASRNFFASFLAVLEVESNAGTYFPGIHRASALAAADVKLKKPILYSDLLTIFGGDRDLAQLYNPHFQRNIYLNRKILPPKVLVSVPSDKINELEKIKKSVEVENEVTKAEAPKTLSHKESAPKVKKYRVSKGDTLYRISRQLGVSLKKLLALNKIQDSKDIKAGQLLKVP